MSVDPLAQGRELEREHAPSRLGRPLILRLGEHQPGRRPQLRPPRLSGVDCCRGPRMQLSPARAVNTAAAARFSVIRCPPRSWALLAVGLPGKPQGARTSTGLPRSARMSCDRGGCPLNPEDGGAHPGRGSCSAGACRSTAASPSTRFSPSILRPPLYEASTRIYAIHPSGLPQACSARMERPPLGFPEASHPADQEPTSHAEVGPGHRARTWKYSLNITSVDPPIGSSFIAYDLVSQRSCGSVYVARMTRLAPLATDGHPYWMPHRPSQRQ